MTAVLRVHDCALRTATLPAILRGFTDGPTPDGMELADELLADLDVALDQVITRLRHSDAELDVAEQILCLKQRIYDSLLVHLRGRGWTETALAALAYSAECDLCDSRERLAAA